MAADLMDTDLDKIHTWADTWLVKFNPHKTEELIISRKITPRNHPAVTMDNVEVKRVDCHKHLGLICNTKCTWNEHIDEITTKAWKRIHLLQSLKYQLDRRALQTMYFSFVRPILEYADVIWDNCFDYEKAALEKIQIEAGRIVSGATKSCSKAKILFELGWDTLEQRRYKHRMITFFKMVKNLTPPYLQDLVPPNVHQVSNRNLRNQTDFTIPRSRTNLYDSSFIPTATREWNSLPAEIKSSTSISIFKRMLNRDKIKVPSFFYNGDRKAQVLHARLRLGCSSLNADLFNNHISMTNKCSCGSIETAEHFFLHCRKYTSLRDETINTINVNFNINILLNGCPLYSEDVNGEIFDIVQRFITESDRF